MGKWVTILFIVFCNAALGSGFRPDRVRVQPKDNNAIVCAVCKAPLNEELAFQCSQQHAKVHKTCIQSGEYAPYCSSCDNPLDVISSFKLKPILSNENQKEIYEKLKLRVDLIESLLKDAELLQATISNYKKEDLEASDLKNRLTFKLLQARQVLEKTIAEGKGIQFEISAPKFEPDIQNLYFPMILQVFWVPLIFIDSNSAGLPLAFFSAGFGAIGLVGVWHSIFANYRQNSKKAIQGRFEEVLKHMLEKKSCYEYLEPSHSIKDETGAQGAGKTGNNKR